MPHQHDLLIDKIEKHIGGNVIYMAVAEEDAYQFNSQSCDCSKLIIVMTDRILSAVHVKKGEDGAIGFEESTSFNEKKYNLRIVAPPNGKFEFMKAFFDEDGATTGIKYRYGDRYVFVFASELNLIVTKSMVDLFEEEDTPLPMFDTSVLFE